jgi:hypothetical protein
MASFNLEMSSPVRSDSIKDLGGPNSGGHKPPDWFIQFGMDLGVTPGTEILAAFSGYVSKFTPHTPSSNGEKVYGAQLFVRSNNSMMGAFYTHFARGPSFSAGQQVQRGDRLGVTLRDHLHMALVEIVGGLPGGRYSGVNLHSEFLKLLDPTTKVAVTFPQTGSRPFVGPSPITIGMGWLHGWWKVWDGSTYYYFFDPDGTVRYTKARPADGAGAPARADNIGRYFYSAPELLVTWKPAPGAEAACKETFYNAAPDCRNMNARSNLYSPLVATRSLD